MEKDRRAERERERGEGGEREGAKAERSGYCVNEAMNKVPCANTK